MKLLVLNAGSSSLKYSLFEYEKDLKEIGKGKIEEIGKSKSKISHKHSSSVKLRERSFFFLISL